MERGKHSQEGTDGTNLENINFISSHMCPVDVSTEQDI